MASRGAPKGHKKAGGRQKSTPNKRSLVLYQGLIDSGCIPAEQLAAVFLAPTVDPGLKIALWEKLLPYLYPQQKAIDPDQYVTVEQAAGMVGAKMLAVRRAIEARVTDPMLAIEIIEATHER